jgi:hypothetical protein
VCFSEHRWCWDFVGLLGTINRLYCSTFGICRDTWSYCIYPTCRLLHRLTACPDALRNRSYLENSLLAGCLHIVHISVQCNVVYRWCSLVGNACELVLVNWLVKQLTRFTRVNFCFLLLPTVKNAVVPIT